jgi:hypothetical protein
VPLIAEKCATNPLRFPDERTPIEATPLSATSAELDCLVWVWVWGWDGCRVTKSSMAYTKYSDKTKLQSSKKSACCDSQKQEVAAMLGFVRNVLNPGITNNILFRERVSLTVTTP